MEGKRAYKCLLKEPKFWTNSRTVSKKMNTTYVEFKRTYKFKFLVEVIKQIVLIKEPIDQELTR